MPTSPIGGTAMPRLAFVVLLVVLVFLIIMGIAFPGALPRAAQSLGEGGDLQRIQWMLGAVIVLLAALVGLFIFRMSTAQSPEERARSAKDRIAVIVIYSSFGILLLLLLVAFWPAVEYDADRDRWVFSDDFANHSIQLIGLVLPVLGTWVGTVLAFYFARENFEAAQVGGAVASRRAAASTPASEVMVPIDQLETVFEDVDDDWKRNHDLGWLKSRITGRKPPRAILKDKSGNVLEIIHEETIDHYNASDPSRSLSDSIKQLLEQKYDSSRTYGEIAKGFGCVGEGDTLAKCQSSMEQEGIRNVIVTKTGEKNVPPIGLITDDRLRSYLRP